MGRRAKDTQTLNLLDWEPPQLIQRYAPERVRAAALRAKIARGVSETLTEAAASRAEVAAEMSAYLGEEVSENMLNAYASEARDDHTISFPRLVALVNVTRDVRLLQLAAEMLGYAVIEERYLEAAKEAMWTAAEDRARDEKLACRRRWRGR